MEKTACGIRPRVYLLLGRSKLMSYLLNSLVNIYGLTPGGKGDRFDKLDSESKLAIEFVPQIPMYSVSIIFTESIGRHDHSPTTASTKQSLCLTLLGGAEDTSLLFASMYNSSTNYPIFCMPPLA